MLGVKSVVHIYTIWILIPKRISPNLLYNIIILLDISGSFLEIVYYFCMGSCCYLSKTLLPIILCLIFIFMKGPKFILDYNCRFYSQECRASHIRIRMVFFVLVTWDVLEILGPSTLQSSILVFVRFYPENFDLFFRFSKLWNSFEINYCILDHFYV